MNATAAYFDHAATSPMRPEAIEALQQHLGLIGNPAALHRAGQRARAALEEARESLAEALDAHPREVIFTSGGSEADSLAVLGGWAASGRPRALISAIEHPAVLGANERGAEELPVTAAGVVDLDAAEDLIDGDVGVVSVMSVNNETGIQQPVEAIRQLALRAGAWMHTDAVQAFGHQPLSFRQAKVDLMSVSAHKLGGPVGIGALVCRRDVQPAALMLGGGQERGVRSGTAMVAMAASFAAAAQASVAALEQEDERLRGYQARIAAKLTELGAHVNTFDAAHAPHIVNATFPDTRAQDLLFLLDQRGVAASVGSACRAGVHQPSEVLLAMGRSEEQAASTLRFSMGWSTTETEVETLLAELERSLRLARLAFGG